MGNALCAFPARIGSRCDVVPCHWMKGMGFSWPFLEIRLIKHPMKKQVCRRPGQLNWSKMAL